MWHTGEYIWAGVAILLTMLVPIMVVSMLLEWRKRRTHWLADLKQAVGTSLVFLMAAAGCYLFGVRHYDPLAQMELNLPDNTHQLVGLGVAIWAYCQCTLLVHLCALLVVGRVRSHYWDWFFNPWFALGFGLLAAGLGIFTTVSL